MRSRRRISCGDVRSNTRAAPSIRREQAFLLKFGVRARHRIGRDTQIARELPYRRQTIPCAKFSAFDEPAELIHYLLEGRQIRIDREEKFFHDAVRDKWSR